MKKTVVDIRRMPHGRLSLCFRIVEGSAETRKHSDRGIEQA